MALFMVMRQSTIFSVADANWSMIFLARDAERSVGGASRLCAIALDQATRARIRRNCRSHEYRATIS